MLSWAESFSKLPSQVLALIAVGLVIAIGIADYVSTNDVSLAVFYVFPIAIAAWYVGPGLAHALSIMSIAVWILGDFAVGNGWVASGSIVALWNAAIRLVFYFVITEMLVHIRALNNSLEARALQRAIALNKETDARQRLERELLNVSERERRRLGYDLHDGLCQHLTGTAFAVEVLTDKLTKRGMPEAQEAARVADLVREGMELSHRIAQNLQPLELQAGGLMMALQAFAASTSDLFKVSCQFECETPVLVRDIEVADHLYRIAQEAVGNAIKHGKATKIVISLDTTEQGTLLRVKDNGVGISQPLPDDDSMGMRIMEQRAKLTGASFDIQSSPAAGTMIECCLPHPAIA